MKKIIQYYVRNVYGIDREYIVNPGDAAIMLQLTGQKTITGVQRELIRDLTNGLVHFERVSHVS